MKLRLRTEAIVIHTTASAFGKAYGVKEIREQHLARGFADIGYHFLIGLGGEEWAGRTPIEAVGAHVKDKDGRGQPFNLSTVAVSYVGGLGPDGKPFDTRTPKQISTMIILLKRLLLRYPKAVIVGHRDLSPDMDGDGEVERHEWVKECPCFGAGDWAKGVGLPGAKYSLGKYVRL